MSSATVGGSDADSQAGKVLSGDRGMIDPDKEYAYAMSRKTVAHQVRALLILKLKAARAIGEVMGWIGKNRIDPPPGLLGQQREEFYQIFRDPSVHPIRKAFGELILEYYDPDWKRSAPADVIAIVATRPSIHFWAKGNIDALTELYNAEWRKRGYQKSP